MNIDELELTVRSDRALRKAGINSVEKLLNSEWPDIRKIENLGAKSLSEIAWSCVSLFKEQKLKNVAGYNYAFQKAMAKADKYDALMDYIKSQEL